MSIPLAGVTSFQTGFASPATSRSTARRHLRAGRRRDDRDLRFIPDARARRTTHDARVIRESRSRRAQRSNAGGRSPGRGERPEGAEAEAHRGPGDDPAPEGRDAGAGPRGDRGGRAARQRCREAQVEASNAEYEALVRAAAQLTRAGHKASPLSFIEIPAGEGFRRASRLAAP